MIKLFITFLRFLTPSILQSLGAITVEACKRIKKKTFEIDMNRLFNDNAKFIITILLAVISVFLVRILDKIENSNVVLIRMETEFKNQKGQVDFLINRCSNIDRRVLELEFKSDSYQLKDNKDNKE